MAEEVVFTAPVVPPSRTKAHIRRITIDIDAKAIGFDCVGDDGVGFAASYPTTTPPQLNPLGQPQQSGAAILNNLNNRDGRTVSLIKKGNQLLQADGYMPAGNITGTPD